MACKSKLSRPNRSACVGDLSDRLEIAERRVVEPTFGGTDFRESFPGRRKRWAQVSTVDGKIVFDATGVGRQATHEIVVRFERCVSSESWVILEDGRRLEVLKVEDPEERHEWLILTCLDKGIGEASKA